MQTKEKLSSLSFHPCPLVLPCPSVPQCGILEPESFYESLQFPLCSS